MPENDSTPGKRPPELWRFVPINNERAVSLAVSIANRAGLWEDDGLAALLVSLIGGIAAHCGEGKGCWVSHHTWPALFTLYATTQRHNDGFFDYVVNDLRIARDLREGRRAGGTAEGQPAEQQPIQLEESEMRDAELMLDRVRGMVLAGTMGKIVYVVSRTQAMSDGLCEITDAAALLVIRELLKGGDAR